MKSEVLLMGFEFPVLSLGRFLFRNVIVCKTENSELKTRKTRKVNLRIS